MPAGPSEHLAAGSEWTSECTGLHLGYEDTRVNQDQIAAAAECLNMDPELAAGRAYEVRDGIIRVSSDIRGVGTVLIGPDLSVLFFASYVSLEKALEVWDTGRRTQRESFAALRQQHGPGATTSRDTQSQ